MASAVEILAIVRLARQCASDGVPAVLARLVSVEGSHYRKPGARMLLARDGRSAGAISAGCLEADLRERLPGVLSSGRAEIVEYDSRTFEDLVWGLGSGCNGLVRILLSPFAGALRETLERASDLLSNGRSVRLETVVSPAAGSTREAGDVRLLGERESPDEGRGGIFVEEIRPAISLLIVGRGPDAAPVARLAAELGWAVSVLADRGEAAARERFAGLPVAFAGGVEAARTFPAHARSAAVVMSHRFADDAAALEALLPRGFPYLGVLGPRERTKRLLRSIAAEDAAARVRSPAGLNVGAETAEEIALSIVAEIQEVLSGSAAPAQG